MSTEQSKTWQIFTPRRLVVLAFWLVLAASSFGIFGLGLDTPLLSDDWTFLGTVDRAQNIFQLFDLLAKEWGWWYLRPVEWVLTYGLYKLFGIQPWGYHLTSILLHLTNVLLVGLLAHKIIRSIDDFRLLSVYASMAVAALFAFSWRHDEAVFWYSSINELLAAFFRLSATILLLFWIDRQKVWWLYAGAFSCFVLGVLSKESAIVSLGEIILLSSFFVWVHGQRFSPKILLAFVPFVGLAIIWIIYYGTTRLHLVPTARLSIPVGDWMLRLVQHLNSNVTALRFVNHHIGFLWFEVLGLGTLTLIAAFRRQYLWIILLLWTFISAVPYAVLVPEIQYDVANRFLYFSSIPTSLLVVYSVMWMYRQLKQWNMRLGQTFFIFVVLLGGLYVVRGAMKLVVFESQWQTAGQISAKIIQQITTEYPDPSPQEIWCFASVPDHYRGKYIFRNGIQDALYLAYGRRDFVIKRINENSSSEQNDCTCVFRALEYRFVSDCLQ